MRRTIDATFLNSIANDPLIRPLLGGQGPIDTASILKNVANVAMVNDEGGFVGIKQAPGIYEIHTLFKLGSGNAAFKAAKECLTWMFINTDCYEIRTKVPASNKSASWLSNAVGCSEKFTIHQKWGEKEENMLFFSMTVDEWCLKEKALIKEGRDFHDLMGEIKHDDHGDDEVHYAYVGAAMLMAKAGNGVKGADFYNKWAAFSGYQQITILSANPQIFEMNPAIVQITPEKVEIMLCQ